METRKGFTLIEVLLIVVIFGIIAAIVVPRLMMSSVEAEAKKNLNEIGRLQNIFMTNNNGSYLACPECPSNDTLPTTVWKGNEQFDKLGLIITEKDNKERLRYKVVTTDGYRATATYTNGSYTKSWYLTDKDTKIRRNK